MAPVNLAATDLNLLVVLDALLTEKSVSRAAQRIHSTQPAVSRALGRLRALFDDPLLTRTRSGMVPTPMALALTGEVRAVLEQIQGIVGRREGFDPASSKRTFRVTMSEFPQYILCGPLLTRLADAAPFVTVNVLPWSLGFPEALESGSLDLVVCPPTNRLPGLHSIELFSDELMVIVRRDHPTVRDRMTLRQFAALTHIVTAPNGRDGSLVDDLLEAAGLSRRVLMRVPGAVVVPAMVASTDCCATVPSRLAAAMAEGWGLKMFPVPKELDLPGISQCLVWHERSQHDPASAWLREELRAIAAQHAGPKPAKVAVMDLSRRAARTL